MGQKYKKNILLLIINSLIILFHPSTSLSKEVNDKQDRREKALEASESLRNLDRLRKQNAALLQQNLDLNKMYAALQVIIKHQAELIDQLTSQNRLIVPQAQQGKEHTSLTTRAFSQKVSLFESFIPSLQKTNTIQKKIKSDPLYFTSLSSPQSQTSFFINQDFPFSSKITSTLTPEPIRQQNIIIFVPSSLRHDSIVESKEIPTISTHNRQEHTSIEPIVPNKSDQSHEILESKGQPLHTLKTEEITLVEEPVPVSSLPLSKAFPSDRQHHAHLTAQLQELEQQNYVLEQELRHRQEVEQNFLSLQARHEDLLQELDILKGRLFIVQDENQALRLAKTADLPIPKAEQPLQVIQGPTSALKENELEQRIHALQGELATNVSKQKQQDRTTQENIELQRRMVELEKRLVDLGRGGLEKEAYAKQLNDTIEELKKQIDKFEQENSSLKKEQAISRATTEDLHQKNSDLDRLLSELYHRISILESDKKTLEKEIITLKRHIRFLEVDEIARKHADLKRVDDNQVPLLLPPAFKVSEPTLEEEASTIPTLLEAPLLGPISDNSEKEQAYQKRLVELSKRIDELSLELSRGQAMLQSTQNENAERKVVMNELTAKLKSTEKENTELKSTNHQLKNETALRRIDDLQVPLSLPQAFTVSESILEIPAFLEGPLPISDDSEKETAYLKRLKKLNKMINGLSQQLSDKQAALRSTQDESTEREMKLDELTARLKSTEKENSELKSKNHQLKNEKAELKQREKSLDKLIKTKGDALSKLEEKVKKNEGIIITSLNEVSQLTLSIEDLSKQLKRQKNAMEHLKDENHTLSIQNASLIKERDALKISESELDNELEKKTREVNRLAIHTKKLEEELENVTTFSHQLEHNLKECMVTLQMFHVATLITQQRINNQQEDLKDIRHISSQWIQEYNHSSENALEYVNQFIHLVRSTVHPDNERDDPLHTYPLTTPPVNDEDDQAFTSTTPVSSSTGHTSSDDEKAADN